MCVYAGHDSLVAERWPYILSTYQGNLSSRAGQWQALQGRQGSQGSGSTSQDVLQYDGSTQSKGMSEGSNSTGNMPPPPTITDIVLEVAHRLGYNNAIYSQGWNQQPIFLQSFGKQLQARAVGGRGGQQHACLPTMPVAVSHNASGCSLNGSWSLCKADMWCCVCNCLQRSTT